MISEKKAVYLKLTLSVMFFFLVGCTEFSLQPIANDEPWLLFEKQTDEGISLYKYELGNLSQPTRIVPNIDLTFFYSISPDGQYITVINNNELRLFNLQTEEQLGVFTIGPSLESIEQNNIVAWSPKNDKVAFTRKLHGPYTFGLVTDIVVFDLISQELQIIDYDAGVESALTWSSDGKSLIFATIDSCNGSPQTCPEQDQLWHIDTIDLETHEINSSSRISPKSFNILDGMNTSSLCQLEPSPDAKHILYRSYCITEGIHTMDEMFITNLQNDQTVQLTDFGNIDYSNKYSYIWDSSGEYFIIGYKHDYILNNSQDENGFLTYRINEYETPIFNTKVDDLLMLKMNWSPKKDYVLGIIGPDNITFEKVYVGQINNGKVVTLSNDLPLLSLAGCWTKDGYITQFENRLVKLQLPELEIVDLNLTIDGELNLINCVPGT